jgi:hypothetical protein
MKVKKNCLGCKYLTTQGEVPVFSNEGKDVARSFIYYCFKTPMWVNLGLKDKAGIHFCSEWVKR